MGSRSGGPDRRDRGIRGRAARGLRGRRPGADLAGLPDRTVVLPWANLRTATGERKATGLSGSLIQEDQLSIDQVGHFTFKEFAIDGLDLGRDFLIDFDVKSTRTGGSTRYGVAWNFQRDDFLLFTLHSIDFGYYTIGAGNSRQYTPYSRFSEGRININAERDFDVIRLGKRGDELKFSVNGRKFGTQPTIGCFRIDSPFGPQIYPTRSSSHMPCSNSRGRPAVRASRPPAAAAPHEETIMNDSVKYLLDEARLPKHWYNLMADLPSPPPPVLHPGTLAAGGTGRPRAAVSDVADHAGGLDRARDRDSGTGPRRLPAVAPQPAVSGPSSREGPADTRRASTTSTRA